MTTPAPHPLANGKSYITLVKHRGGPSEFSQWAIPFDEEVSLFCRAVEDSWCDSKGNFWGILPDAVQLGQKREVISKFPKTSNDGDPWHGYPVSPLNGKNETPHHTIVNEWHIKYGLISRTVRKRILLGQL